MLLLVILKSASEIPEAEMSAPDSNNNGWV